MTNKFVVVLWLSCVLCSMHAQNAPNDQKMGRTGYRNVKVSGKMPGMAEVIPDFYRYIESVPFYAETTIEQDKAQAEEHLFNLRNWSDKEEYIRLHHLKSNIHASEDSIAQYARNMTSFISNYLSQYEPGGIADKNQCIDSLQAILSGRLEQRQAILRYLSDGVNELMQEKPFDWKNIDWKSLDWKLVGAGLGVLLLLILIVVWAVMASRKSKQKARMASQIAAKQNPTGIVVTRRTTAILRKQSLEDVIGNSNYFQIDSSEFCPDSAVRRMFIKNTCIKDIYHLYAEDLRNATNPKENGCMVLGRWVHDKVDDQYYVSLEQIVLPGDDAVFSEYELNFGGKIKLKVTDLLRRLRKDTGMQYDLTCWVHSHPGLGIFFSQSDNNVQLQLKHPTHPNFLTAIVVDILTPKQDFGIFTFKRDSTISSAADLKKMYSLEELYKWAVESDRNSFKPEDHYNTLAGAKQHIKGCDGIELSNGAIIDIDTMTTEQESGNVGMVHGFCCQQVGKTEYVAVTVSQQASVPDQELVGCFVLAAHCSIPSVRKAVAAHLGSIRFVLVYSSSDGMLTSIPVVNGDLSTDESYYGEQTFEDLKIWTRRKR